ncbi:MAG: radical SAM/SPASM domain-containing protein [Sulfurovaceae bacterium]|nr:radical SAM/SPASM domain-containing protein [Sulfurovaceae bacterium]MDD5548784.1 radical SAM/SPASM domain-containing protein [Sulfurovaceae bacterium]
MRLKRVYVELTNICGLNCTFCPDKNTLPKIIDLVFFEKIVKQVSRYTNEIVCHVMGDPLTLSNIQEYLEIIKHHDMKAMITTSGFYIDKHSSNTLLHPVVRQLNISLNSFNKNNTKLTLDEYLKPIFALCKEKIEHYPDIFINLRLWNIDDGKSEDEFNIQVFDKLSEFFGVKVDYTSNKKGLRLASKVLLHFDNYFEWPSLSNPTYGDGYCGGLDSHIAILSDGTVVPCCLDYQGIIELGNLQKQSLDEILGSSRTCAIKDGFKQNMAVEELCQRCSYKSRFEEA